MSDALSHIFNTVVSGFKTVSVIKLCNCCYYLNHYLTLVTQHGIMIYGMAFILALGRM